MQQTVTSRADNFCPLGTYVHWVGVVWSVVDAKTNLWVDQRDLGKRCNMVVGRKKRNLCYAVGRGVVSSLTGRELFALS